MPLAGLLGYQAASVQELNKENMKTSVVHNDKIKCDHKGFMVIWDSYENYATCRRCGFHDWSGLNDDFSIASYKEKYPDAEVVDIFDGMENEEQDNQCCGEPPDEGGFCPACREHIN